MTLMPGPDILFVITQSMTRGKRAGIVFAAGLCSGLIFHTLAVSLGVSLILYESPIAFMVLKVLGASYLIYLSVRTFLRRKDNVFVLSADKEAESRLYRKGVLMNILNPKVLLFFVAVAGSVVHFAGGCDFFIGGYAGGPFVSGADAASAILFGDERGGILDLFCDRD